MPVSFLRPLYERPGPWASVYLDGSRNAEHAPATIELRRRSARIGLDAAGCDPATAEAIGRSLLEHAYLPGSYGPVAFATAGGTELVRVLPGPPRRATAACGPLPHAMPLLAQLGESIPYVRVLVNRTGADVEAVDAALLTRTETVEGPERWPLRRIKAGGWLQPRYQRAPQVSWERNAGDVAVRVAAAARQCGAEVIVVAGDPQARPLLVAQLPEYWRERVVQTGAGDRAAGAGDGVGGAGDRAAGAGAEQAALDEAMVHAVAERGVGHTDAALERYRMQRGHDAAGDGLPAVVAALQRGQVDTVLLVDDPSAVEELWVGPEPLQLSFDRAELEAMGVASPQRCRA